MRLHLEYSGIPGWRKGSSGAGGMEYAQADAWASAYSAVAAGAALAAGLGVLAFLKRANNWFAVLKGKRKTFSIHIWWIVVSSRTESATKKD